MLHFKRPSLALAYLDQLREGGEPIALFSPRRTGKTAFLRKDLQPAAEASGMLVVYVDVWQDKQDPADAIVYALQAAIDDLHLPTSRVGRGLATPVRKVGLLGASLDFGDDATPRRPEKSNLLMDSLLRELVRTGRKKILLMIDEVQQLALVDSGEALVAALRSSLTKQQGKVHAVLTGSSRDQLNELFFRARAPMYEFASVIKFPLLGCEFIEFVADRHQRLTGKRPDTKALLRAFEQLDHRPKLLYRLLDGLEENPRQDIATALKFFEAEREIEMDFAGLWTRLPALQKAVLTRIANDEHELYSNNALAKYQAKLGGPVNPGSVRHAVNTLRKNNLLAKIGAVYEFESRAFAVYVRQFDVMPRDTVSRTKARPGKSARKSIEVG